MIFDAYLRWRHSKGFGVHSPFAYHIVTTAVKPGRRYGYYGYSDIDTALESAPSAPFSYRQMRSGSRLLLRLAVALGSRRLFLPPDAHPAIKEAAKASGAVVRSASDFTQTSSGDLLIITSLSKKIFNDIKDAVSGETAVMLLSPAPFDNGIIKGILSLQFEGVMFYGTRTLLLLPRKDTAHVCYSIAF